MLREMMRKVEFGSLPNGTGNVSKKTSRHVEDDGNIYRIEKKTKHVRSSSKKPKLVLSSIPTIQLASEEDSLHMLRLPSTCISLCSKEGQRLLEEACTSGTAKGFWETLANVQPQLELNYCGLASLVTVLNALQVDPEKIWKGCFRWYEPSMLAQEQRLDEIKVKGVTLEQLVELIPKDKVAVNTYLASETSLNEFRKVVLDVSSSIETSMILSYSRQALKQVGDGHFSPIGAYHKETDSVLVLDVARFKYPPHWVDCGLLWSAMNGIDNDSGKSRGFIKVSKLQVNNDDVNDHEVPVLLPL